MNTRGSIPGLLAGLALVTGLLVGPAAAAAPPALVRMTLRAVDADGAPIPDVFFVATSTTGAFTHEQRFRTDSRGVGRFEAYAETTASVRLGYFGKLHGRFNDDDAQGFMYSADDPSQPYSLQLVVGKQGSTDSLTLPDLVTRRVKLVTRSGRPVMYARVTSTWTLLSVPETDSNGDSFRVMSQVNARTNSAGWVKLTTFEPESDITTLASWGITPHDTALTLLYDPTTRDIAQPTVRYGTYLAQTHYRLVAPYSPHFVHVRARPGRRHGVVVVTAVARQATGVLADHRVLLWKQRTPNALPTRFLGTRATHLSGRTDNQGRVTFRLRLAHQARLVLWVEGGSSSPGVVVARPR